MHVHRVRGYCMNVCTSTTSSAFARRKNIANFATCFYWWNFYSANMLMMASKIRRPLPDWWRFIPPNISVFYILAGLCEFFVQSKIFGFTVCGRVTVLYGCQLLHVLVVIWCPLSVQPQDSCVVEELTRLMGLSLGEPIPAYSRREQTSYRYIHAGASKRTATKYLFFLKHIAVTSTSLWWILWSTWPNTLRTRRRDMTSSVAHWSCLFSRG